MASMSPTSTVTETILQLASMTQPPSSQNAAPITRLVPVLTNVLSFLLSWLRYPFNFITQIFSVFALVLPPLISIFRYLLSPVFVLVEVLAEIFLWTPLNVASYIADALYPIYVFCGVAILIAAILGGVGRGIVLVLVGVFESRMGFNGIADKADMEEVKLERDLLKEKKV